MLRIHPGRRGREGVQKKEKESEITTRYYMIKITD